MWTRCVQNAYAAPNCKTETMRARLRAQWSEAHSKIESVTSVLALMSAGKSSEIANNANCPDGKTLNANGFCVG